MDKWVSIKEEIIKEVKGSFFTTSEVLEDLVNHFEKVLLFPLNRPELRLDGLESRVPNAMEKILLTGVSQTDAHAYFPDFGKIEPYLRKIYFLTDPQRYQQFSQSKKGLGSLIKELNLNLSNVDLKTATPASYKNDSNYADHLLRTYSLRNIESHQCETWTRKEFFENVESILIIYLFATKIYYSHLRSILNAFEVESEADFSEYLTTLKENFKNKIGRYVHIHGKEDLKLSVPYVVEQQLSPDGKGRVERKGTVGDLRKYNIPEKRMLLWGDAGMGKTTTLEYLAYQDAEERLVNSNAKIPVYLALGLLTDKNVSVKQNIFNRLGIDNNYGERLLKEGRINLFLDAINEIPKDDNYQLKTLRQREIQNLLNDYKNTFTIISNRPQDINEFKSIPVFQLQKMNDAQIEIFLDKNTDGNNFIKQKILSEIKSDLRLKKIITTPLMLSRLIEIVKTEGDIPKSEGEIINRFIHTLYYREKEEKKDANFDVRKIHRLLRYLGYESLEKKGTNAGMVEDEVLNYFVDCKKKFGFEIDIIYVLEISTNLNILEKMDDMYTFAHQAYQDYYHSQEEKAILGI